MTATAAFAIQLRNCGLRACEIAAAMRWTVHEAYEVLQRYGG
jgi:hypothetical protein